jgi:hypothetical protein
VAVHHLDVAHDQGRVLEQHVVGVLIVSGTMCLFLYLCLRFFEVWGEHLLQNPLKVSTLVTSSMLMYDPSMVLVLIGPTILRLIFVGSTQTIPSMPL